MSHYDACRPGNCPACGQVNGKCSHTRRRGNRKPKPPLESALEDNAIKHACGPKGDGNGGCGCLHYKQNGLGRMGKPDQAFVTPNGYVWWVEFKRTDEEPTELQVIESDKLLDREQLHSFIWTFDEFRFKLDWILSLPPRKRPKGW